MDLANSNLSGDPSEAAIAGSPTLKYNIRVGGKTVTSQIEYLEFGLSVLRQGSIPHPLIISKSSARLLSPTLRLTAYHTSHAPTTEK